MEMPAFGVISASSARKPRVGFVGVGWIGRNRMEAIAATGAVDIVAIAEPDTDLSIKARQVAPEAEIHPDLSSLLECDLDAVVIATPSALHAGQSIAALEAGLSVFCQKPLGRNAEEVQQVVEVAERSDRLLGVDLSYRYVAGAEHIRELVQGGELGDLFAVDLVFHNAYGPDKPWFYDPALSGGGCLIDLGIHLVDLALWTLGFPEVETVSGRLFSKGESLGSRTDRVEDYAVARLDLAGGAAVSLACSWHLQAGYDAIIGASFYGTRGGIALRNVNGSFYDFTVERFHGTRHEVIASPPDAWGGRAAAAWAHRLATDCRFDPSTTSLIAVAETLDAIYREGRTRNPSEPSGK